ncbi:MAG: M28 family peptidase, partial [Gemmatimonadaceae bacterium]
MRASNRQHTDAFAALKPVRQRLAAGDDALIRDQVTIAQLPAPSGDEGDRACWMRDRFAAIGLFGIRIDDAGNVIGRRPGRRADEPVVVCAHLDTVFSRETPHVVIRDGRRFQGPSITDNSRGLAAMLAVAGVIGAGEPALERPVEFVGT